ncbi:hypothetical protein AALA46_00130 [Enterocloster aldenensis]|uniref:hypothetical protein n=1 Tax=Enterocloster aldenensis TaxID=358742 RepID=UPI0026018B71|nr:hypothetical protein [Enterocloster clostridioformis]
MRYFIMRQNTFFSERFRLNEWQEKINPKWLCFQDFYKTPRRCILTASIGENVPFPDIVIAPFLLLSNLMMDVVKLYGEPVYKRDVIIISEHNQQSKQYYLTMLETAGKGRILLEESNLFCMDIKNQKEIVVSQDFAESILRRGAVGIDLEEIEEGKVYGK